MCQRSTAREDQAARFNGTNCRIENVPEAAPMAARTGTAYLNMLDIMSGVRRGLTVVL
jgi:hypothetical protein